MITPMLDYIRISLAIRLARARAKDTELGASVVEWVVITSIVVLLITAVALILIPVVEDKAKATCTAINSTGSTGTSSCS